MISNRPNMQKALGWVALGLWMGMAHPVLAQQQGGVAIGRADDGCREALPEPSLSGRLIIQGQQQPAQPATADAAATEGEAKPSGEADCASQPSVGGVAPGVSGGLAGTGRSGNVVSPLAAPRAETGLANRNDIHSRARQGGAAAVNIGGTKQQFVARPVGRQAATAVGVASPSVAQPLRNDAVQVRLNDALLDALERDYDGLDVLFIAPSGVGDLELRHAGTVRAGPVTGATQKRLMEAAIEQADRGEVVVLSPLLEPARPTDRVGRLRYYRDRADRVRLREVGLKALRDGRPDRVFIFLELPR